MAASSGRAGSGASRAAIELPVEIDCGEDRRLAREALGGRYISEGQLIEAVETQARFARLGLARRPLGDIMLQRGDLTRHTLRELYRRISPDVDLPAIEGYRLIAKIGEGGMGVVYEARQLSMDRAVAIKVLHPALAEDELYLKRFTREARMAAMLNHPNIVAGIDVGSSRGRHYFVMELVEGQTVKELIREGGWIQEKRAFDIAGQVASALEQAARHALVHRDIKPENILLSDGIAKLCDLGLARPEGTDDALTETGATHGTPFYMSPEQACGEALDVRSDIYALGATLYEMVTGVRPFSGRTAAEVLVRQISDPPTPPRDHNPELSPAGEAVILKMLAKRPEDRYGTPRLLVEALREVAAGKATRRSRRGAAAPPEVTATATARAPRPVAEAPAPAPAGPREAAALGPDGTERLPEQRRSAIGQQPWATLLPALGGGACLLWMVVQLTLWLGSSATDREPGAIESSSGAQVSSSPLSAAPPAPDREARQLFEYAREYEAEHAEEIKAGGPLGRKRLEQVRARYQQVVRRFSDDHAFWAYKAQDRLEALDAERDRRAMAALTRLRERVSTLARLEQWRAAWFELRGFDWPAGAAQERQLLVGLLNEAMATQQAALLEEAARLASREQVAAAIRLLEGYLDSRPPIDGSRVQRTLEQLRGDQQALTRLRASELADGRDARFYRAFQSVAPMAGRLQLAAASAALDRRAAGEPELLVRRRLRWLSGLLRSGVGARDAALNLLSEQAGEAGPELTLIGPEQRVVRGRLRDVERQRLVLRVGERDVRCDLARQRAADLAVWARGAPALELAGLQLACGWLRAAERTLAAADDPRAELVLTLRLHGARVALEAYRGAGAARDAATELAELRALLDGFEDLPPVAGEVDRLRGRAAALATRLRAARVKPVGEVLAQEGARWTLRYRFDQAQRADWTLGPGWSADERKALQAAGGKGRLRYRWLCRPGACRLSLRVQFVTGGDPGLLLAWRSGEDLLQLELRASGELVLDRQRRGKTRRLASESRAELNHGIYNIKLVIEPTRVSASIDNIRLLHVKLDNGLRPGVLEVGAPAGALRLSQLIVDASLEAPEEGE